MSHAQVAPVLMSTEDNMLYAITLMLMLMVLMHRTHTTRTRMVVLDPVFVASFTTAPARTHVRVVPVPLHTGVPVYALPDEVEQALTRLALECEQDKRPHTQAPAQEASTEAALTEALESDLRKNALALDLLGLSEFDKMPARVPALTQVQADWDIIAEESLTHTHIHHADTPVVKIQHIVSSTERMRAQRAAYAAQGLTARGTVPQPMCLGTVDDASNRHGSRSCKRKAVGVVENWTKGGFCSYGHAAQYGLELVWEGTETMEQAKARMTKV